MARGMLFFLFLFISFQTVASDEPRKPEHQHWSFATPLGTFDRKELQRGFQVYKEVCAACHGLEQLRFRELKALGFNEKEVKTVAATYQIQDGPNDEGDMYQRPGRPGDTFPSPFANEQAARAANAGAYPPDLSLITKAREHGPDYLYALLAGYEAAPSGVTIFEGKHYNPYFQGGQIAMPPPLTEGLVTYGDGTPATPHQMARDVTAFLSWMAEPDLEQRHEMGVKVLLFLLILSVLLYGVYQALWKNIR
jgi:ubiquinol-cytochrome c reductase cytochrome c1 subunit